MADANQTNNEKHWGKWIDRRSRAVGFKRQGDFADAIGCGRTQLAKWIESETPPYRMRKGFDASLVAALKTDRAMLFSGYQITSAESAKVFESTPDQNESIRRRVLAMVELMPSDGLKELAQVGERLLRAGMAQVA